MNMKKISIKYGDFYKLFNEEPSVDFYVKTHKMELAKINAAVEKDAVMYDIKFNNGYRLCAADSHAFMDKEGNEILTKDLKINTRILTIHGTTYPVSIKKSKETKAYDINIPHPHWYINDEENGIIHHNTLFGLIACKAYLDAHEDAMMIFYDSEGGASKEYFASVGIDPERVIYIRIMNIEEFKVDIVEKLEMIKNHYTETKEYSKFVWFVDSIGNLASLKEVEDAKKGSSAVDMGTRAKSLKAMFRIITPYFDMYNMHFLGIMHTYDEMASMGAPRQIMSGGCLVEGTEILLSDGKKVEIQEVKEGDIVSTRFGPSKVSHIWNPDTLEEGFPECVEVAFEDGYKVVCSVTHPFLVRRDTGDIWVDAGNLVESDDVVEQM